MSLIARPSARPMLLHCGDEAGLTGQGEKREYLPT
jgi:hypothetical protein